MKTYKGKKIVDLVMEDGTVMTVDQILALIKETERLEEENAIIKKANKFFEEAKDKQEKK